MMPIVHFVISIGIAFGLELKGSRKYLTILALGIIGTLPDIDHLLPMFMGTRLFHNTLFLAALPLALLIASHFVETDRGMHSSAYQRFFMGVTAVLLGHLLLDIIAGSTVPIGLLPGSSGFSVSPLPILDIGSVGVIVATDLFWLLLLALVIFANRAMGWVHALYEEYGTAPEIAFPSPFNTNRPGFSDNGQNNLRVSNMS